MKTFFTFIRITAIALVLGLFARPVAGQAFSFANGKYEIGLGIGPSFFLGDLGGSSGVGRTFIKDVDLPMTKMNKGLYLNIYPAEWLGFRIAGNIGMLEADDAQTPDKGGDERFRLYRNLKFRSTLLEAYGAIEFYPTVFFEKYDGTQGKIRPYGVIGAGLFHFNPQGEYFNSDGGSQWVDLKPLRLEGQGMAEYPDRKPYALTQLMIPMGAGIKYYFRENLYFGFEVMHRKTFTDYIDDVSTTYVDPSHFSNYLSDAQLAQARQLYYRENLVNGAVSRPVINEQRGDPRENDSYFSGVIRMGWRINGGDAPDARARKQLKCPVFY
ncbi:MAG: hypothetical protein RJA57_288 [Bacteroidota bacterium]|jgi:hypothetical protein